MNNPTSSHNKHCDNLEPLQFPWHKMMSQTQESHHGTLSYRHCCHIAITMLSPPPSNTHTTHFTLCHHCPITASMPLQLSLPLVSFLPALQLIQCYHPSFQTNNPTSNPHTAHTSIPGAITNHSIEILSSNLASSHAMSLHCNCWWNQPSINDPALMCLPLTFNALYHTAEWTKNHSGTQIVVVAFGVELIYSWVGS